MRHLRIALWALFAWSSGAHAATLTITPDKWIYHSGETITLSIVGDSQGEADLGVVGFLLFDRSLASWQSTTQKALTSYGGTVTWYKGGSVGRCDAPNAHPGCPAFDQILFPPPAAPVDNLLESTMLLTAIAPGVLNFSWEIDPNTGWDLHFFSLTDAPGASITILTPEPSSADLLALGLLAIAARRTRRTEARTHGGLSLVLATLITFAGSRRSRAQRFSS